MLGQKGITWIPKVQFATFNEKQWHIELISCQKEMPCEPLLVFQSSKEIFMITSPDCKGNTQSQEYKGGKKVGEGTE